MYSESFKFVHFSILFYETELSRPLAAVLSIEFPWNRAQKKSDGNAERNGFATFAKLKHVDFDSVAETFRDGSDGYSGHLITCA